MIWRSGDRVIVTVTIAVGLFTAYGDACSIVTFGELPIKVSAISGTAVGNVRFDDAKKQRKRITRARIQILTRTDVKYSKDVVTDKVRDTLPAEMVFEWSCGNVVASTTSDSSGQFAAPQLKPGKYCIDVAEEADDVQDPNRLMNARFLVDVQPQARYHDVTTDITPLWPDCTGGSKIAYADQAAIQGAK